MDFSLDLVKNRVGAMTPEMRKLFVGTILVGLIDKTQDAKVMKAIMKMVEDWVKTKVCIIIIILKEPHLYCPSQILLAQAKLLAVKLSWSAIKVKENF